MPARRARARIFSIEGEWSERLTDRRSAEPLLNVLRAVESIDSVYARVATRSSLRLRLRRWCEASGRHYEVLHLSFHGPPGLIEVGDATVSLGELSDWIAGAADGRTIYFDACETFRVDRTEIERFRRSTGARIVAGFTKSVGWLESAAFDLLLLDALAYSRRRGDAERWMRRHHGEFCDRLGLVIA